MFSNYKTIIKYLLCYYNQQLYTTSILISCAGPSGNAGHKMLHTKQLDLQAFKTLSYFYLRKILYFSFCIIWSHLILKIFPSLVKLQTKLIYNGRI